MRALWPNCALLLTLLSPALVTGCDDKAGDEELSLEDALNEWLRAQYPEGYEAGASAEDVGVDYSEEPGPSGYFPVWSSSVVSPSVSYSTEAPVTALCVGFGDPADAWCIPTSHPDVTTSGSDTDGRASLALTLPPELCAGLSEICHDITCYEFAETEWGTFSAADVEFLAAACGACDEPSCQDFIDECSLDGFCLSDADCAPEEACVYGTCVGSGPLQFTLNWSSNTDFDLYVLTPTGAEISYQNERADSGTLDHDDTSGGANSIENVFFTDPPAGTYTFWVNLYSGPGGSWSMAALSDGDVLAAESGSLTTDGADSTHFTVDYGG